MTRRVFLALLALLTGLSVQGSAVEAREIAAQGAEIGAVAISAGARQATLAATGPLATSLGGELAGTGVAERSAMDAGVPAPRVLMRIDRARE